MKNLSFLLVVTTLALGVVSCGNKDKDSASSGRFTQAYSTQNALINTQSGAVEIGGTVYQVSQQSYQIMSQAFQQAQQQQIQPVLMNGVYKFKAKITGSLAPVGGYQAGYQQPNQQYPNQGVGNQLNVTQALIYR
ncbi:MAG: hypothetical protein H0V66_09760 [Bdellovibrionales bacterium]|nr:hypothetical protein [Bdellovibrionales bacterium]